MGWTTLSFAFGSVLTSTKMTQMHDNHEAVARGQSGAPKITFTGSPSGIISDFFRRFGNGGLGAVTISANTAMNPGTYNFASLTINSGYSITAAKPGAMIFKCTSAFNLYGTWDMRNAGAQGVSNAKGLAGCFGGAGGAGATGPSYDGGDAMDIAGGSGVGPNISNMAVQMMREFPYVYTNIISGDILGGGAGGGDSASGDGGGVAIVVCDVFDSTSFGMIDCRGENGIVNQGGGGGGYIVRGARVFSADVASYAVTGGLDGGGNSFAGGDGNARKIELE